MVVLKDVNVEEAAGIAVVVAFLHSGQLCMSSARIIVEKEIARPFAEALAKKAKSLQLGDRATRRQHTDPSSTRAHWKK